MKAGSNLTGQRFGRLTVISSTDRRQNGKIMWYCECDCGGSKTVASTNLTRGYTQSCGCLQQERLAEAIVTHGKCKTRLYRIWCHMKERCYKANCAMYNRYGGRGITVCDDWQKFEPFYAWAMANGYEENLTIDRINNDGNYCPENCRWATIETQMNNQSTNKLLTYNGKTQTMAQWARELGIRYGTLQTRIYDGWTAERALSTKVGERT